MRLYELDNHSLWHLMLSYGSFYTDDCYAYEEEEENIEEEGEED